MLHVDGLHHLLAVGDRRLLESLTATKLFNNACLLIFTLEFFEGSLDVFAFLDLYDNHRGFLVVIVLSC